MKPDLKTPNRLKNNIFISMMLMGVVFLFLIGYGGAEKQIQLFTLGLVLLALSPLVILLIVNRQKNKTLLKANADLANFHELIQTYINADEGFVFLKDEHLRYVFVNKAMEDFLNLPAEKILGYSDQELMNTEFANISIGLDKEVLEQGQAITSIIPWNKKYYRDTKFPVKMHNGTIGVGANISDITQEYLQQTILVRVAKRNQLLLEVLNNDFSDKQKQLDYMLQGLLELSGSKYGFINLYDEAKEEFAINAWTAGVMRECGVQEAPRVIPLAEAGIWGEAVRRRRAVIINDFQKPNPLIKGFPSGHVQMNNFISVPVIIDGQIVATIGQGNKEIDYDDIDMAEMTMVMSGVWNAIQRRETADLLAYERNKYYQTLLSIGDGVLVVDNQGKIEFLNSVASTLTGWSLDESLALNYQEVFKLSHEQDGALVGDPIARVFASGETHELGDHVILTSRQGIRYHIEDSAAPIFDDQGVLAGAVLVFRDVTQKKAEREKIAYLSFHDPLTGLYNRRFFEKELRRLDKKENLPIAILLGDVNGLKLTNDIVGHGAGDLLLKKVAQVMQKACRTDDIIARWGGDEFVLLLPRTSLVEGEKIKGRIKEEVAASQVYDIACSISLGIDVKTKISDDLVQTLRNAEANMYATKTLERGEVQRLELGAIIKSLYDKSQLERKHAQNVSLWCARMGKALNLRESKIQKLVEAGRLHDIGKVVLDSVLLTKTPPLSLTEEKEMAQHPVVGYRMLAHFEETLDLAEIVLAHHERWDGTGYPKGLQGEQIPFKARIISIVEAYDRMVHHLDKEKVKSPDEALEEIKKHGGRQFDPHLVEVFIALFPKNSVE